MAVGGRSKEKADKVADDFSIQKRYGSYEGLLADEEVEAVYISHHSPGPCRMGHQGSGGRQAYPGRETDGHECRRS